MNFWTTLVIIVAIIAGCSMYRARIKSSSGKFEELFNSLSERVARMEKRTSNLETIILDREKAGKFEGL